MSVVKTQPNAWIMTGVNTEGATGSAIDMRGSRGAFVSTVSASSNGPSANASAQIAIQHSPDLTAWFTLATQTASSPAGMYETWFTAGVYGYIRVSAIKVYSAAQTGTAFINVHILGGIT